MFVPNDPDEPRKCYRCGEVKAGELFAWRRRPDWTAGLLLQALPQGLWARALPGEWPALCGPGTREQAAACPGADGVPLGLLPRASMPRLWGDRSHGARVRPLARQELQHRR